MSFKGALLVSLVMVATLHAGKFPSAEEATRQLLAGNTYDRETTLLTKAEQSEVIQLANQKKIGAFVSRYIVRNESGIVGYAYLDKHLVRTLPETLLVAVDSNGALVGIKVLAFREPAEFMAREGWMEQFHGRRVEDQLRMRRNVDGITGATITARAITQCARRMLAIHQVLEQRKKK